MLFEQDFWGGADMFGRLAPSTHERGKFFLFYSYSGISGMRRQALFGWSAPLIPMQRCGGFDCVSVTHALHISLAVSERSRTAH